MSNKISHYLTIIVLLTIILFSCNEKKHLINDSEYRGIVEKQFSKQKSLAADRSNELFKVFEQDLTLEEREALKFLYAFMPLNDLADYTGENFLSNIRVSLQAKSFFSWGNIIPDDIFRHFVLPYRVNNENLDTSRIVFFNELKNRVKDLSMKEAVLEINHWCHEKVEYKSTDIRTSAPLSTVKTAFGRCGEESTFTTAALRSVGIPARQCYTPRWAHSDDNHAWVEVWVDGKWNYLGACEPEPDLNIAWFNEPVKRAMLVHTTVFGKYSGPEEIINEKEQYSKINLLKNYTATKKIHVKVTDNKNNIIENANVEFLIYNYAEFYPIAKKLTDKNGICSFSTGLGYIIVWVHKNNEFGYKKVTIEDSDTVFISLSSENKRKYIETYDLTPPVKQILDIIPADGKQNNELRLKYEDSIRMNYVSTFIDSAESVKFAEKFNLNIDRTRMFLHKSRGNWKEILIFLENNASEYKYETLSLLSIISEKDLRDTKASVLSDHLRNSFQNETNKEIYIKYILNPRISNEMIVAHKEFLQNSFDKDFKNKAINDVSTITQWIIKNINIKDNLNYYDVPISPKGVFELKVSDSKSRDIFFVALCRSLGIPSRLNPTTLTPEYYKNNKWYKVKFDTNNNKKALKGYLTLNNINKNLDFTPKYYIHFTIGKYENGTYKSLDLSFGKELNEFPDTIKLKPGKYVLVTGNRMPDGSVLSKLNFFDINQGELTTFDFEIRDLKKEINTIGKIKLTHSISSLDEKNNLKLSDIIKNKTTILAWIDPDKEPTKHSISDLENLKLEFEEIDCNISLLLSKEKITESFDIKKYKNLPSQKAFYLDNNYTLLKAIEEITKNQQLLSNLPVFIIIDKNGEIFFLSTGYKIGTGEQLLKALKNYTHIKNRCLSEQ